MATMTREPEAAAAAEEEKGGGKLKLVVIALVLVIVGAGAAYWFMFKPKGAEPPPEPGEVVALDPIQVNLADGHYLSIGIALQGTTAAHEMDGSKALDATIETFSGKPIEELNKPKSREHLKEELLKELEHLYHGDVMDVYFTQFVTQ
jgi:flagellar protein FliL